MIKRFSSFAFSIKNLLGEVHELPKVMDTATGDDIIAFGKIEPADKKLQQTRVRFLIVNKTDRLTLATVLQTLFNFLYEGSGNIIVNIDLCVACYVKNSGMVMIISEITKDIGQVETDHVFEEYDMMFAIGRRKKDKPALKTRWHLDDGIHAFQGAF